FAGLISCKRHRFDATQEHGNIGIEWHLQYPPLTSVKLETVPCSSFLKTPPPMLCSNPQGMKCAASRPTSRSCPTYCARETDNQRNSHPYRRSHHRGGRRSLPSPPPSGPLIVSAVGGCVRGPPQPTLRSGVVKESRPHG